MQTLRGLAILLLAQSAGEAIARLTDAPLPGPVLGMLLLLLALRWSAVRAPVEAVADTLLAHLSLLFVPVGVGVLVHVDLIAQYGLRMLLVIVLATWIALAVTALVLRAMLSSAKDA
jgi:holin-like protein